MSHKVKVLLISDDLRISHTGIATQAQYLVSGLLETKKYDIVQIGVSLLRSTKPVKHKGITIYPCYEKINANLLRYVVQMEKPDIIIPFGDPRFFYELFLIDDEIRTHAKIVYNHLWDNEPFPKFNIPFYKSCDKIVSITKFTHNLLAQNGIETVHIPHCIDTNVFKPLPKEQVTKSKDEICRMVGAPELDFIVFWNNRNLTRKQPGLVVEAFTEFFKTHPNSCLIMHTDFVDPHGTDILAIQEDIAGEDINIVNSATKLTNTHLNMFYNVSDVTINFTHNEGFGLTTAESLAAGTPIIATNTGGLKEQLTNPENGHVFGRAIEPASRLLDGTIDAPYIYRDIISLKDAVTELEYMYNESKKGDTLKDLGLRGREYIKENFSIGKTVRLWDELLQEVHKSERQYRTWTVTAI